ncbi:hypothetical protein EJ04DRAFT_557278 [Polyplosphaeria fusca]|uniref:NACHT domain-containing protein n=1 Tax=Polyplosphaeria fusca TaxID=682080 RepID=A0A9P4QHW7_9PLEO|nr:hypothetical protein EJ04DRAFT_557278 [Polyplosphaeria fusca]
MQIQGFLAFLVEKSVVVYQIRVVENGEPVVRLHFNGTLLIRFQSVLAVHTCLNFGAPVPRWICKGSGCHEIFEQAVTVVAQIAEMPRQHLVQSDNVGSHSSTILSSPMEALTALGLASNVVQFVDFASKIVSQAVKIYRAHDGSSEHRTLAGLTSSLQGYNKILKHDLAHQESEHSDLSAADKQILQICGQCEELTRKLLTTLNDLRSSKMNVWTSFVDALKTVWSDDEVQKMRQILDSYRQQIALLMMVSVRDEIRTLQKRQTSNDERLISTVEQTRATVEGFFGQIAQQQLWQEEVTQAIHDDYERRKPGSNKESLPAIDMQKDMSTKDTRRFHEGLLTWLRFSELDHRYQKIEEAHEKTFDWIFRKSRDYQWSDFTKWLKSDSEPLYWITGKPASGKSTLMKYIHSDWRTKQNLHQWAQEKKLITTAFYFWNAGTTNQMSEDGMARTLLYETLRQEPKLSPLIFPQKLEEYLMFSGTWRRAITWDELKMALRALAQRAGTDYKLFFLVDGLDECQGDHAKLITMIKELSSSDVKICTSSRPWNVFEDGFQQLPNLRLENLTSQDIEQFVSSKFQESRGFTQLRALDPNYATDLIKSIITKASGVFLWVSLVTNSLLGGLLDGERLEDLHERLEALPTDLESLFWSILTRLQGKHLGRASELIQIVRAAINPVDLLTLSYADEKNPDFALTFPFGKISIKQANARAEFFRRGLNACCKGLIESKIRKGTELAFTEVGYLHKTVKDYFEREDIWSKLIAATDHAFNPHLRLCTAYIVSLKINGLGDLTNDRQGFGSLSFWDTVIDTMQYATVGDPGCKKGQQPKILDELDRTATQMANMKDMTGKTWLDKCASGVGFPVRHWSVSRVHGPGLEFGATDSNVTSFLHAAIQCQLTDYVHYVLNAEAARRYDTDTLSRALVIACGHGKLFDLASAGTNRENLRIVGRDPDVVEFLLAHGADPNAKLQNITLKRRGFVGDITPWGAFLYYWTGEYFQRLGRAFLENGADPSLVEKSIPELYDFARRMEKRRRRKEQRTKPPEVSESTSNRQKRERPRWWNRLIRE